jgi:hypothetical protein
METSAQQILIDAFNALPSVVQQAILSSDLEEKMRSLAQKHKIHFDKWTQLENEITYALFGITAPEDLTSNIEHHVGLSHEDALAINNAAVDIIFEPIRKQLQQTVATSTGKKQPVTVPIEQQKVLTELGVQVPAKAGTATATKTLDLIIKQRLASQSAPGPVKPGNRAGDSEAAKTQVSTDPYRELPA